MRPAASTTSGSGAAPAHRHTRTLAEKRDGIHHAAQRCALGFDKPRILWTKEQFGVAGLRERGRRGEHAAHRAEDAVPPLSREAVDRADELRDMPVCRAIVDFARRADLLDAPGTHDDDAVAQFHRLGLIVRDVDRRHAEPAQERVHFPSKRIAQPCVERGERLVEQQHARLAGERAGERDALTLAARELADRFVGVGFEPHHREQFVHAAPRERCFDTRDLQPVAYICAHVEVGKERIALKHHADLAALDRQARDIVVAECNGAAGIGRFEAGDDTQRGGLAATGRAEQHDRLAGGDRQIDRLEHACRLKRFRALLQRDRNGGEFHGGGGEKRRQRAAPARLTRWPAASTPSHCMATSSGIVMTKNRMV